MATAADTGEGQNNLRVGVTCRPRAHCAFRVPRSNTRADSRRHRKASLLYGVFEAVVPHAHPRCSSKKCGPMSNFGPNSSPRRVRFHEALLPPRWPPPALPVTGSCGLPCASLPGRNSPLRCNEMCVWLCNTAGCICLPLCRGGTRRNPGAVVARGGCGCSGGGACHCCELAAKCRLCCLATVVVSGEHRLRARASGRGAARAMSPPPIHNRAATTAGAFHVCPT